MKTNSSQVFKRYEIKYLLNREEEKIIKNLISKYMWIDEYGKTTIRNIYYDTPNNYLVRKSNDAPVYKEKLRVRSYNEASPDSVVFIELKKKLDGIVYKRRIAMTEIEAMEYLNKKIQPSVDNQITREIDYFYNFYKEINPSVFLSYDRVAYKNNSDLRITFDDNIIWRDYDLSLEKGIYGKKLLDDDYMLMEIKTENSYPLWLARILSENKIYKTSFSKYGNIYKGELINSIKMGGVKIA